jgi:hypothetical protein
MAQLKYLPAGVRLHLKLFLYQLRGGVPGRYYFKFHSIPEGLKAEKLAKSAKIPFASIPIPDQIYPQCGISLVVDNPDRLKKILRQAQIDFETYRITPTGFEKVE